MPVNRMIERQRPSKKPQQRDVRPAEVPNPFTGISWGEPGWPWGFGEHYPFYGGHFGIHAYGGGYLTEFPWSYGAQDFGQDYGGSY